ncbi:MAG TPA: hypothetical protein VHG89_08675 [Verrucomicrobiae bacterium]|nr:hypothetical protein [Verrucomicrobiae bacterium]
MKNIILSFALILVGASCSKSALLDVEFEWFNLSTNEIYVSDAIGLPVEASPGILIPVKTEDQLNTKSSIFSEAVRVKDQIAIKWNDNGTNGFHGDFELPGKILPGMAHQIEFKRDELGIPSKLTNGKVRFTYLGNDKWRIKFFPQ